jgi:hypothetical protein
LLNNLGLVAWNLGDLFRHFWPVLIIAVGLDLMLGRGSGAWATIGSLVAVLVLFSVVAVGTAMVAADRSVEASVIPGGLILGGGPVHNESFAQPLDSAQRARVELEFGTGSLSVAAQEQPAGLADGTLAYREGERVDRKFYQQGGTGYLRIHGEGLAGIFDDPAARGENRRWDLKFNPEVPMTLTVHGGVGKADLDLSQLHVTDLEMHNGIGQSEITLPQHGRLQATVEGGIGKTTIVIPEGMAARIDVEKGISSINVIGNYMHQGNSYISPGYSMSKDRVDLKVKGGIGKITVQEYEVR